MSETREERLALNEVLFRTVNENIAELAAGLGGDDAFHFICECASAGCFERVSLQLAEYEAVRGHGSWFFLLPGHEDIEIELVVETHDSYIVVEKDGLAGLVAEADDPRG